MKKITGLIIIVFLSLTGRAQRITPADLVGTWNLADTSAGKMIYTFTDSIHVQLKYVSTVTIIQNGTYLIEKVGDFDRVQMIMEENGQKMYNYFLMKLANKDLLKLQVDNLTYPPKWAAENANSTATLVRKRSN